MNTVLVTGGAGFIGSALVQHLLDATEARVVVVDKLSYAGNPDSLVPFAGNARFAFEQVDVCDAAAVAGLFETHRPTGLYHLAAESHVDRSIEGPGAFVQTNVVGTFTLLHAALTYWRGLDGPAREAFRFLHVSTDEVYGSLGEDGLFTEETPYDPSSPYSASKAASDHFARAWHRTYGLPVLVTNCSNNYGPRQFPEKLIPVVILKALRREPIPVYGVGQNVRDWLFVLDHARALHRVLEAGRVGETYNIGGNSERTNLDVVRTICRVLDEVLPEAPEGGHEALITFVQDRPGHDFRYAIDATKIERELGWRPSLAFEEGIRQTIVWYLENEEWWGRVLSGAYQMQRLGLDEEVTA